MKADKEFVAVEQAQKRYKLDGKNADRAENSLRILIFIE